MTDRKTVEDEFVQKASELLDERAEHMDAMTRSKLHQARNQALAKPKGLLGWQTWSGAGALAASFAIALVYFDTNPQPEVMPALYADTVQQAAAAEMELMDDLDFVAWLVLQESEADDVVDRS